MSENQVSVSERLRALVHKWRAIAETPWLMTDAQRPYRICADELDALLSAEVHASTGEGLRELAERLQREKHENAIYALRTAAMFSAAAWQHNAGPEWPDQPDDDSYLAFENCKHPDCRMVLAALPSPPTPAAQLTQEKK